MTDRVLPIIDTDYKETIARREDGWVYMCFSGGGVHHSCSASPPVTPQCEMDPWHVACPDPAQSLVRARGRKVVEERPKKAQGWKKGRKS